MKKAVSTTRHEHPKRGERRSIARTWYLIVVAKVDGLRERLLRATGSVLHTEAPNLLNKTKYKATKNQTKPNQTKPNQTEPYQIKPNQTKPNQTKPNQTIRNQSRPKTKKMRATKGRRGGGRERERGMDKRTDQSALAAGAPHPTPFQTSAKPKTRRTRHVSPLVKAPTNKCTHRTDQTDQTDRSDRSDRPDRQIRQIIDPHIMI